MMIRTDVKIGRLRGALPEGSIDWSVIDTATDQPSIPVRIVKKWRDKRENFRIVLAMTPAQQVVDKPTE